jgi:hypothetical protein
VFLGSSDPPDAAAFTKSAHLEPPFDDRDDGNSLNEREHRQDDGDPEHPPGIYVAARTESVDPLSDAAQRLKPTGHSDGSDPKENAMR